MAVGRKPSQRRRGRVLAETVYGLSANALDPSAVAHIFERDRALRGGCLSRLAEAETHDDAAGLSGHLA
jgi:hypothetical protein